MFKKNKLQVPVIQEAEDLQSQTSEPRLIRRKSKDKSSPNKRVRRNQDSQKEGSESDKLLTSMKFLSASSKIKGENSENLTSSEINTVDQTMKQPNEKLLMSLNFNHLPGPNNSDSLKKSSKTEYFTVDSVYNEEEQQSQAVKSELIVVELQREVLELKSANEGKDKQIATLKKKIQQSLKQSDRDERPESERRIVEPEASVESQRNCVDVGCVQWKHHLELETKWMKEKADLVAKIKSLEHSSVISNLNFLSEENLQTKQGCQSKQSSFTSQGSAISCNSAVSKALTNKSQKGSERSALNIEELRGEMTLMVAENAHLKKQVDLLQEQIHSAELLENQLKQKINGLYDELKYINIENRTLLSNKTKMMKLQMENLQLREERDQFKKKAIENFKRVQQLVRLNARKGSQSSDWSAQPSSDLNSKSIESLVLSEQSGGAVMTTSD